MGDKRGTRDQRRANNVFQPPFVFITYNQDCEKGDEFSGGEHISPEEGLASATYSKHQCHDNPDMSSTENSGAAPQPKPRKSCVHLWKSFEQDMWNPYFQLSDEEAAWRRVWLLQNGLTDEPNRTYWWPSRVSIQERGFHIMVCLWCFWVVAVYTLHVVAIGLGLNWRVLGLLAAGMFSSTYSVITGWISAIVIPTAGIRSIAGKAFFSAGAMSVVATFMLPAFIYLPFNSGWVAFGLNAVLPLCGLGPMCLVLYPRWMPRYTLKRCIHCLVVVAGALDTLSDMALGIFLLQEQDWVWGSLVLAFSCMDLVILNLRISKFYYITMWMLVVAMLSEVPLTYITVRTLLQNRSYAGGDAAFNYLTLATTGFSFLLHMIVILSKIPCVVERVVACVTALLAAFANSATTASGRTKRLQHGGGVAEEFATWFGVFVDVAG